MERPKQIVIEHYPERGIGAKYEKFKSPMEKTVQGIMFAVINTMVARSILSAKNDARGLLWKAIAGFCVADVAMYCSHMYFHLAKVKGSGTRIDMMREAFKKHHDDPTDYLDEKDTNLLIAAVELQAALFLLTRAVPKGNMRTILDFAIAIAPLAQLTHKYAHCRNHDRHVPKLVRVLQDMGIILSGEKHKAHHSHVANVGNWSILSPLSNALCNPIAQLFFTTKFH